jgi:hypothetical protein
MTLEARLARAFAMDEATWARHANPWSVWTRATALPLLVAVAWSRVWLGEWAVGLGLLALAWMWLNPRLFPPPASTRAWSSRAVLGERVWLNRTRVPVPAHHRRVPHVLSALSAAGLLLVLWGVLRLSPWPTLAGLGLVLMAKFWFLDRMAWLYADMQHATPEYAAWLY